MRKLIIILFIISSACSGKDVYIKNFDQKTWQEDKFGCNNERGSLYKILINNKEKLIGLNNREIINYLGKPDKTELHSRNQKFFHYYITPGLECSEDENSVEPALLSFRFNATGQVNEITLFN